MGSEEIASNTSKLLGNHQYCRVFCSGFYANKPRRLDKSIERGTQEGIGRDYLGFASESRANSKASAEICSINEWQYIDEVDFSSWSCSNA